jgi:DNA-binding MarR family transcriptional regulator
LGVLNRRRDVLVEPEEVGWVVAALDGPEAVPGRPRVGFADSRLAVVAEESDVCAGFALAQRRGEVGDPGVALRMVLGSLVERGDVGHDPAPAVREGGGLDRDASHRPAEHPQLRDAPRRVGRLQEFGPASQAALSRRTGIYRSDLVAVINELAGRGLIQRAPDPADRRRNVITMTPHGRRHLRQLDKLVATIQDDLLAPLTQPERDQLVRLLARLLDHHAKAAPQR